MILAEPVGLICEGAGYVSDWGLRPPHPQMRSCVVVPARNEEERLSLLIRALGSQRDLKGRLLASEFYEVLLLLNNCTDQSAKVARKLQRKYRDLRLHVAEVSFAAHEAHVGKARQTLFDAAFQRFDFLDRPDGLIITTDADSRPAPDWIAQNQAEIATGVDGVGGRVLLEAKDRAELSPEVRRFFLLDIGYRCALEELRSLYAPEAHDPFPRHHQHFGASLAVTAATYARAGGMPLKPSCEDVALYHAILERGGRFRHSNSVRVYTSGRIKGRAQGGLADAIAWWKMQAIARRSVLVESAEAADARLSELGRWLRANPWTAAPAELSLTPERPAAKQRAEIHATLRGLRERIAMLRPLSLSERLALYPNQRAAHPLAAILVG